MWTQEKTQFLCSIFALCREESEKGKRSFAAARAEALETGVFKREEVVSVDTLYSYAENGEIAVKNIDLPEKVKRKQKRKSYCRKHKRLTGESIEKRPETINEKRSLDIGKLIVSSEKRQMIKCCLL